MKYKGYIIAPVGYQGTTCYKVTTPGGEAWRELACDIKTAKKWIEWDRRIK